MVLSDLKEFDIVKLRNGVFAIVLYSKVYNENCLYSPERLGCFERLSSYNENLKHKELPRYEIVAVYNSLCCKYNILFDYFVREKKDYNWKWERRNDEPLKVGDEAKVVNSGMTYDTYCQFLSE